MKKLGKNFNSTKETIEAYSTCVSNCQCWSHCQSRCGTSSVANSSISNDLGNNARSFYNNLYYSDFFVRV